MTGVLVLVTGTGRSGTSTIAGTMHHLGVSVPGPYLGANASNPKGFFESKWAVKFHKQITAAARINDFDSRPDAFDRAQEVLTPDLRAGLVAFLRNHASAANQILIKDPRSVWVQRMWKEAAADAGLEIRYLSMLRHPAEVVGSRTTYYANSEEEAKRRTYETFNVARWVNSCLISERETRGDARTFVSYTDLLDDWRSVMRRVRDELALTFDDPLEPGGIHAVDDFIDPGLRRHGQTWDELDVPHALQDVAQRVWDDLVSLSGSAGVDPDVSLDMDVLAGRYEKILEESGAISHDLIEEVRDRARREGAAEAAAKAAARRRRPPRSLEEAPVQDVRGRDLLRVLARRAVRKVRR